MFSPQPLYDMTSMMKSICNWTMYLFPRSNLWYNCLDRLNIYKTKLIPVRFENINDFLVFFVSSLHDMTQDELPRKIANLSLLRDLEDQKQQKHRIPIALMYGDKEKFIFPKSRTRLFNEFGIKVSEVIRIDPIVDSPENFLKLKSKNISKNTKTAPKRVNGYIIIGGGHFAYANFDQFTNRIVESLLKQTTSMN